MLSVIINEDIREIRFDSIRSDNFMHPKKPLRKFVPFQIPAILAHYANSVEKSWEVKKPSLERFIVKNVDILSRTYAMKNSMFEVLTMYDETMHYLEVPGKICIFFWLFLGPILNFLAIFYTSGIARGRRSQTDKFWTNEEGGSFQNVKFISGDC